MASTGRWIGVAWVALALVGCPKKPPIPDDTQADSDADTDAPAAAPAAPTPTAPAVAANEAQVTHYPDQNPDMREPMTTHVATSARSEASSVNGHLIAQLRAGVEADKLADHDGFDLVLFSDPQDATRKIEGWVPQGVFIGVVRRGDAGPLPPAIPHDAGPRPPAPAGPAFPLDVKKSGGACPAGYAACSAICRHTCRSAADCGPSGAQCSAGFCLGPGAVPCAH
jgi:hypothetical protein